MKKFIRIAAAVLSAALVASCGNSGNNEEAFVPALPKDTMCTIKIAGSYSNFEALEMEFDRFKTFYNKDLALEYVKPDDYDNNLGTILSGEDKPNIFFAEPRMLDNEKYSAVVPHMEDLSDPNLKLNLDCIRPNLINRDKDGKVRMVPIFSRTYGALVNVDLFKKEGIEIPTTWSGLISACEAFLAKNYKSPIMGYSKDKKSSSGLMNVIAYPLFIADLAKNPEALRLANDLDPAAGAYMRPALEKIKTLIDKGCINIQECDQIGDNYTKTLLRFLAGDVPMMVCNGDTVSGAKKREKESPEYKANPFNYQFYPIPVTEQGGYFVDSVSLQFAVNKDCDNLDMTNEFMRFLLRSNELNDMAASKGLISTSKSKSSNAVYAPFNNVPAERTISPEDIGVKDTLVTQIRIASYEVGKGMDIDTAVSKYGQFN